MQHNTVETYLGAFVAALILFGSNLVTLFVENPDLTLTALKQSTWIAVGGGALVAFLKDFQAVNTRNALSKMTKTGNVHGLAGWFVVLVACFTIAACTAPRPKIDSLSDAIVVTSADIETAATEVRKLCGNTAPNGPCVPLAPISTEKKDELKKHLQTAVNYVAQANWALTSNDEAGAADQLSRAETLLLIVQTLLREHADE